MNEAQKVALTRAKALLTVAGVAWAVRLPDGTVEGDLPIAAPAAAEPAAGKPKRTCVRFSDQSYVTVVKALKAGDTISVPFPPECIEDAKRRASFFASVRSKAQREFGADKTIIAMNGSGVDVLRVE